MRIAFLHAAEAHAATFGALLAARAPQAAAAHAVAPELLALARREGPAAAREGVARLLAETAGAHAVVCTCSTLGPVAEALEPSGRLFRADRPMMEEAAALGPGVLVVACIESAMAAALELLAACRVDAGGAVAPKALLCDGAWPLFERDDAAGFVRAVAAATRARAARGDVSAIVLAQASMAPAAALLAGLGAPVLTSPETAVARAVALAALRAGE